MNSTTLKTLLLWLAVLLMVIFLWRTIEGPQGSVELKSMNEFMDLVQDDAIDEVTIDGRKVVGKFKPGQGLNDGAERFTLFLPSEGEIDFFEKLRLEGSRSRARRRTTARS